jgi:hypothetical protein
MYTAYFCANFASLVCIGRPSVYEFYAQTCTRACVAAVIQRLAHQTLVPKDESIPDHHALIAYIRELGHIQPLVGEDTEGLAVDETGIIDLQSRIPLRNENVDLATEGWRKVKHNWLLDRPSRTLRFAVAHILNTNEAGMATTSAVYTASNR